MTDDAAGSGSIPLSPVVRGGRGTIAIVIVLLPTLFRGDRTPIEVYIQIGVVALLMVLGFVSWLVTRWRIDDDDVLIETGLIRRRSLRFPLSQLQAVDVVRPGLARLFRVAELRLRMGGSTGEHAGASRTCPKRRSSRSASGCSPSRAARRRRPAAATVGADTRGAARSWSFPTGRLVASILISDVGLFAEAVTVALIVTAVLSTSAAEGVIRGGLVWIIGVATLVWRRFNQEYRLTVAESPDGLRVHSGLVALTAETIRPGRVQAVRMVEPMLWRQFGWCRLEVDVAGQSAVEGRGAGAARAAANRAAGRVARARRRAARPPRSRSARCRLAAAAAGPLEEPAALPDARARAGTRRASSRRAGGCAASPAGCRSRRRRASARCRARCSGACSWRPFTSTRSGVAFGRCSATAISRRSTASWPSFRCWRGRRGAATRPSRRRPWRRGRGRSRRGSAPRRSRARRSGRSRRRTERAGRRRAAG